MRSVIWKLSFFLLAAACAILVIDRTRLSLRLNGIASRIAEKSSIIRENEALYKIQLDALKQVIQEKERSFHFLLYSDAPGAAVLPPFEQKPVPGSSAEDFARELAHSGKIRTPEELKTAFPEQYMKKFGEEDAFSFDPVSGVVQSRFASAVEESARLCGLIPQTVLRWEMPDLRLSAETAVRRPRGSGALSVLALKAPAARGEEAGRPAAVCQSTAETTVFPFRVPALPKTGEAVLLESGGFVPVGGCYVHFFRATSSVPWYLDYEFEQDHVPQNIHLRAVSLLPPVSVRTAVSGSVATFRIVPFEGESMVLVIADSPVFVKRITAARGDRMFFVPEPHAVSE